MSGPAAESWREQLQEWAIPDELLAGAEGSPYEWPVELWKRRSQEARRDEQPPTTAIVRSLLGEGGVLVDIGAGTGRASLPLARDGYRLIAVEKDQGMAQGLREMAGELGLEVEVVVGAWPGVARRVGTVDVAMAAHVVYDVPDLAPFLQAMHTQARSACVLEMTLTHPWATLASYYRALHRLKRPDGPRVDDLLAVVREEVGVEPQVEHWQRGGSLWFQDRDEILSFYGRRLVLPSARWDELSELIGPDITEDGGRLYVGSREREMATVWWSTEGLPGSG